MIFIILVLALLSPQQSISAPNRLEVWFLSSEAKTAINLFENNNLKIETLAQLENIHVQCQKYGEQYFHPQFGIHDHKDGMPQIKSNKKVGKKKKKAKNHKYLSSIDTDLISCDKSYFFDLYCGKEKKVKKSKIALEVWVDISSSLRAIDPTDKKGYCYRRKLVDSLKNKCSNKMAISVFDTFIKRAGTFDITCRNYGLNDQKRMMNWIKKNNAKNLILITDISEYSSKLNIFIEALGGKKLGHQVKKILTAKDMMTHLSRLQKLCK